MGFSVLTYIRRKKLKAKQLFFQNVMHTLDWLPGFTYRRPITINNSNNSNALTDYQVLLSINTASLISAGKMKSDCGDLRFTTSDKYTLISYWIESGINTSSTLVWVNIPNIPANSTVVIYMYYGNANATSNSSGESTFLYFDNFDTNTFGSKWQRNTGTQLVDSSSSNCYIDTSNSIAAINSVSAENMVTKTFSVSRPIIIEARAKHITNFGSYAMSILYYDPVYNIDINRYSYHVYTNGTYVRLRYGGSSSFTDYTGDTINLSLDTWYIARLELTSNYVYGRYLSTSRSVLGTCSLNNSDWDNKKVGLDNFADNISGRWSYFDWVLVRKYTSPEPTHSIGNEETQ